MRRPLLCSTRNGRYMALYDPSLLCFHWDAHTGFSTPIGKSISGDKERFLNVPSVKCVPSAKEVRLVYLQCCNLVFNGCPKINSANAM